MKRLLLLTSLLVACAHSPVAPTQSPAAATKLLLEQGVALAREGDLTRAEEYLAAAHRAGGRDSESLVALLSVCVRASRLRSALAYASPYLHEHPDESRLWLLVASVQLALGELAAAQDAGERALHGESTRADPQQQAAAHYLLGRVASSWASRLSGATRLHHEASARSHYTRSYALAPEGRHAEELRASLPSSTRRRRSEREH